MEKALLLKAQIIETLLHKKKTCLLHPMTILLHFTSTFHLQSDHFVTQFISSSHTISYESLINVNIYFVIKMKFNKYGLNLQLYFYK